MKHIAQSSPDLGSLLPPITDSFIEDVRRTIRDRALITPGQDVMMACSGGADSTALVVALYSLRETLDFHIRIAHVNHRLRDEDADEDARWVGALAEALGVPCHMASCDVQAIRTYRKGSIEEVARWARWELLESIRTSTGAGLIATAHHQNDQAETLLLHVLRGAGLRGLAGMSWGPDRGVIRPFLGTPQEGIRAALERWNIPWREDASNASTEHDRNRLRHELLPHLAGEWNPRIVATLSRLAEIAATDDAALDSIALEAAGAAVIQQLEDHVLLDCLELRKYHSGIKRRVVRHMAEQLRTVDRPLSYAETARLAALIDRGGHVVLRERVDAWSGTVHGVETLWMDATDAWRGPDRVEIPGGSPVPNRGVLRAISNDSPDPESDSLTWPEQHIVPPVTIRKWRAGDRIAAVRDRTPVLIAAHMRKTGAGDARGVLVVEDGREILWAVGAVKAEPPPGPANGPTVTLQWETI